MDASEWGNHRTDEKVATQSYADASQTSVIFTGYAEDNNPGEGPRIAIEVAPSWHRETASPRERFQGTFIFECTSLLVSTVS